MQFIKNFFSKFKISTKSSGKTNSNDSYLKKIFKSIDIRKKIAFTFVVVIIYRIIATVPLPGIDISLFNEAFGGNPYNNLFTIVTGGQLDNPSLVAIGLGAYINASIILQLLTTVIPKLEELSKEGERGRKVINQYTRILSIPLAVVQSFVIYTILKNSGNITPQLSDILGQISTLEIATMVITLTAGSALLMWLGELITEYGLGNGVSIIITISILSSIPALAIQDFSFLSADVALLVSGNFYVLVNQNFQLLYAVIIGFILLVLAIVFVTEAIRKIPIQYARRIRGVEGVQNSYLPLKINQAGVIPVIFASAMITFPQIIGQLLQNATSAESFLNKAGTYINNSFLVLNTPGDYQNNFYIYQAVYFSLIVGFSYFYTFITYKPEETADNLKKSGGFIPGLRPGKATQLFITTVLLRLTFVGSIFLGAVALMPNLVRLTSQGQQLLIFTGIGGTSILIVVSVVLETIRQLKSLTVTNSYDQYR
jgi:preprotein translocase subunit SecY